MYISTEAYRPDPYNFRRVWVPETILQALVESLYCYSLLLGGYDGRKYYNNLHQLNLQSLQWTEILPETDSSEGPKQKSACGLVAFLDDMLVVFGGFSTSLQHTDELQYNCLIIISSAQVDITLTTLSSTIILLYLWKVWLQW